MAWATSVYHMTDWGGSRQYSDRSRPEQKAEQQIDKETGIRMALGEEAELKLWYTCQKGWPSLVESTEP